MKLLIHVVPRAGYAGEFADRMRDVVHELHRKAEARDPRELRVLHMLRLEQDPFGRKTPYRGTLEIAGKRAGESDLAPLVGGLGDRLESFAHPDLSTLLFGEEHVIVRCERTPLRFQYLMRRNARFDHDAYLKHYREIHAPIGMRVPEIQGYVQLHVDRAASQRLARGAGLGVWGADSVSELHLASLERFLDAVAKSKVGAEALADEEIFVDRAQSYDFCSTVEWQDAGAAR